MSCREIVTLQVGHFANYVGTHFWNLQAAGFSLDPLKPSEVDHDVSFREGCTPRGVATFLPRLISIDLNGSLGSLKRDGDIYATATEKHLVPTWSGDLQVYKAEETQTNVFQQDLSQEEKLVSPELVQSDEDKDICHDATETTQPKVYNLDDCVKTWTDFMMMRVHPKSVHLISDYTHDSDVDSFNSYESGYQAMHKESETDDIEDKLRYFVEECDRLAGFHFLFDAYNGFSGVSSVLASYLKDEYANKTLVSVPLFQSSKNPLDSTSKSTLLLNMLLSYERMATMSNLVLPMSCQLTPHSASDKFRMFPLVNYKGYLPYHSSSILAANIDTATLSYRLKTDPIQLSDLTAALGKCGRKIAAVSTIFPVPLIENTSICDVFNGPHHIMTPVSLTPYCNIVNGRDLHQCILLRGLPADLKVVDVKDRSVKTLDDLLRQFLRRELPSTTSFVQKVSVACSVRDPFPNIFDQKVQNLGLVSHSSLRPMASGVESVPLLTGIHSSSHLHGAILSIIADTSSMTFKKELRKFTGAGLVEYDDVLQVLEELRQLMSCYN